MKNIKKSIIELADYFVLQDTSKIKLNQNESPYDIPARQKRIISNMLEESHWHRYAPLHPTGLIDAISGYTNHIPAGIIVGNGSNEIIQTVLSTFCEPGDKLLVVSPGFSIYPRLAQIMGLKIIQVPLLHDFRFDISSIIEKSKTARMVLLASPNNPTGTALRFREIEEIAKAIEGILVLDEAYFEFHGETAQDLIHEVENIVILRTFSKAFGLAGIRLGYLLARPEVAQICEKVKLPFSVGIFQQIAGEVMMKEREHIEQVAGGIIKEREKLFSEMRKMPSVISIPSSTNFILFEIRGRSAEDVFDSFFERGVLLRHFGDPRLKRFTRVTVGTPQENEIFLRILGEVSEE